MKLIILVFLFAVSNCYAGFESTLETEEKQRDEKISKNKEYMDSVIGKTAWYNSDKCISAEIYVDKNYILDGKPYIDSDGYKRIVGFNDGNNRKYDDSTYKTNGEYISIKFIDAEIIKNDDILFTLEIGGKEKGYLKVEPLFASVFKNNYGVRCLETEKPSNDNESGRIYKLSDDSSSLQHYERISVIPTYHADMNKWETVCNVDRFNGQKMCETRRDRLYVVILNGRKHVWIIGADYPSKQSAIKIDTNKTIFGTEGKFLNNSIIINQLLNGNTANIRYVQWPYRYNVDDEIDLNGFRSAYEEMLKEYAKLK